MLSSQNKQDYRHIEAPSPSNHKSVLNTHEIEPSPKKDDVTPVDDAEIGTRSQSSDVLAKARAAIASAERTSAAARAATALANNFGSLKLEGRST